MKVLKSAITALLSLCILASTGCSTMTNTGKGTLIGGGGGAAVGAGVGALIGGGKGAIIGTAIGTAVGAGAGALIGKKMDNQQKQLEQQLAESATIEEVTDQNGLQAIKVTFNGGILFPTGKYTLNASAQNDLSQFAVSLRDNPDTNVQVYGYTDNTGSYAINETLSTNRAGAVRNYLVNSGIASNRITAVGIPMADYVASNETAEGRAQNRRVEVYISANQTMVDKANAGTL